jgi:hypothetical protein
MSPGGPVNWQAITPRNFQGPKLCLFLALQMKMFSQCREDRGWGYNGFAFTKQVLPSRGRMKPATFFCLLVALLGAIALAQNNPVPLVNQPLVPDTTAPGSPGFTLTVNGTGFSSGAVVNWNGSSRATSIFSSSQVKATINASDVATAGTAWVTVVNPGPGGGTSNVVYFPIRNSSPSVALGMIDTNVESSGNDVAVGDFNNDGILDVAVAGEEIQIYLGNGDGSFQSPISVGPAYDYLSLGVGDFNNDGNLDLVAWSHHHEGVIFLGQGNGNFVKKSTIPAPNLEFNTTIADFNGDGNLDLCISADENRVGGVVVILLGNGDGTFKSARWTDDDGTGGLVAVGDFNGDGKLDLAVPDDRDVDIFLGNGDGTFGNPVQYQTANGAGNAAISGDVNNDGKLDLITSAGSVLLGNGDGTFQNSGSIGATFSWGRPYFGDFNGDGFLDVAGGFSEGGVSAIDVFLGNGNGTFQSPFAFPWTGGAGPVIGDFNDDGLIDVVAESQFYNVVLSVFLQNGISLSPRTVAYGNQTVGTTSPPQTILFTNYGTSALLIEGLTVVEPASTVLGTPPQGFAQTNNCGTSLPANNSCQIQATFTPEAVGNWVASLNVSYQGLGSPQSVVLWGTGASAPTVSLTPSSMMFTTQLINTTSPQQTATLTNTGTQQVTINSISATPPFAQTNNCPSTLNENASCQIQLTFTPTGPGNAPGTLSVSDNALGSPQTVSLTGTGTVVVFSPISVNFGDQQVGTNSSPVPITLTNEWSQALSISQIQIVGNDPQDFSQTNNCGSSVPAGSYCTFMVTFTPTQTGQRSAQLSVSDNGGASPQTVPLTGTGT